MTSHVRDGVRSAWRHTEVAQNLPRRAVLFIEWQLRKAEDTLIDRRFRRRGLATAGPTFSGFDATTEIRGYVPTDYRVLRTLFPAGSLREDDVLLEYGSGKGRVVMWIASRFPLRRVIGVELDRDLSIAAEESLRRWTEPMRCADVEFECTDARSFEVPDDVSVVYLFNPFMGRTFDATLAKLHESLARRPRPLRVIYFFPIMHSALIDSGFTVERNKKHELYAWATYSIG